MLHCQTLKPASEIHQTKENKQYIKWLLQNRTWEVRIKVPYWNHTFILQGKQKTYVRFFHILWWLAKEPTSKFGAHTLFHTKWSRRNTKIAIHLMPHLQQKAVPITARTSTSWRRSWESVIFQSGLNFRFPQPLSLYSQEVAAGLPAPTTFLS